jgi:hypothetical protein
LIILLTFMGVIFVPGSLWTAWQAQHDWSQLAVGALLLLLGIVRGQNVFEANALAVYRRLGFHPLAVLYGIGAVNLVAGAPLAFSSPIRAYWDYRRDPGGKTARVVPPDAGAEPPVLRGESSRPADDCCTCR